jgi:HEAT repeat protein
MSPVDRYRELVLTEPPSPAALAGLGETGDGSDVAVISQWLSHPAAGGRAQAVRALRKLGAATPERVAQMLTDDSAAVTRQVAKALIGHAREVDVDFLSELIRANHPRHVRVAAYRLLRERDVWTRLSADLRFVDDDETAVKTRARADLDAWLKRDAATTYARPEGATAEELRRLLDQGERFLNPKTVKDLRFHLGLQKG